MKSPASVLLIEDDSGDARLICEYLKEYGDGAFILRQETTLAAGLAHLKRGPVDAVLIDMGLPDSQGLPNVTAVLARGPAAAVIVLSGRNEASLAAAAVRSGAQEYIVKDEVTGPALVEALRGAIERKRAHELARLRDREALQKEFIANVSHEFRTPLAAIKGAAETLQQSGLDARRREQFLAIIERHADRLSLLVEDILQVSVLEAAQRPPQLKRVSLKPIVDQCLSGLAVLADRDHIRLTMDVPKDAAVRADAVMLERILENLCANAIDFNKPGGEVAVSALPSDGQVVLTIKDTGIGIPQAELPYLFDRFHRSSRSRAHKQAGSGLGLMIVKKLVASQEGRVWAESAEDAGSSFHVALPSA